VEDLQEVLADPSLAMLTSAELGQTGTTDASAAAGTLAGGAIAEILLSAGPGPYRAFDDEAGAVLATLDRAGPAQTLADTARRYALAATAPAMWSIAADAAAREQKPMLVRECLARGVESAILSRRIGREARPEDAGRLAGALLRFATNAADQEPALMQLSRCGGTGHCRVTPAVCADGRDCAAAADAVAAGRHAGGGRGRATVFRQEDWRPATSLPGARASDIAGAHGVAGRGTRCGLAPAATGGVPLWQRSDVAPPSA
jgi:hypothetical protein